MGTHYEIDDILGDGPPREGINGEHGTILEEQRIQRNAIRWLGHETQEIKHNLRPFKEMQAEWRLAKWIGGGLFVAAVVNIVVYVTL